MKALQVVKNGKDEQTCQDTPNMNAVGTGIRFNISYGQKIKFQV